MSKFLSSVKFRRGSKVASCNAESCYAAFIFGVQNAQYCVLFADRTVVHTDRTWQYQVTGKA
jgi:hypothetical protein